MAANSNTPRAGGFLLCIAVLAGALTGLVLGQPSIGFLVGVGSGLIIAIAIWLLDSRKRRRN